MESKRKISLAIWSRSNIRVILAWLIIALVGLSISVASRAKLKDGAPHSPALIELAKEKIDLNTAGIGSICRLRRIGQAKAQAIIDYRKTCKLARLSDLVKIKGISYKLAKSLTPYLTLIDDLKPKPSKSGGSKSRRVKK